MTQVSDSASSGNVRERKFELFLSNCQRVTLYDVPCRLLIAFALWVESTQHQPTDCVCWLEHGTPVVSRHRPSRHLTYTKETSTGCCRGVSALQPKIVNMYDASPYMGIERKSTALTQQDTLLQRSATLT